MIQDSRTLNGNWKDFKYFFDDINYIYIILDLIQVNASMETVQRKGIPYFISFYLILLLLKSH